MATGFSDLEQIRQFLDARLVAGGREMLLEEVVAQFPQHRLNTDTLNVKLQQSAVEARRRLSAPLDLDEVQQQSRDDLADEGNIG